MTRPRPSIEGAPRPSSRATFINCQDLALSLEQEVNAFSARPVRARFSGKAAGLRIYNYCLVLP